MESKSVYKAVFPIGNTNPKNLPVADVTAATPFYEKYLGFSVTGRSQEPHASVALGRDAIEIVLAENGGDPEQASCYIDVSDVEAARSELQERGVDLSAVQTQEHGGGRYRVFFVRAPDGLCYCLGQPAG